MPHLYQCRQRTGRTQAEVASLVGVDTSTITHIENGRRRPSIELLARLQSTLKLSAEDVAQIVAEAGTAEGQEAA